MSKIIIQTTCALRSTTTWTVSLLLFLMNMVAQSYAQEVGYPSTLPDIKYHLTARPWQPLNISRAMYLDRVEGLVRQVVKFQNATGAIIDPYAKREVQYATPYFANAVGTLLSAGRAMDLLSAGVAAMNKATTDVSEGRSSIPDDHGNFFLAPLTNAIPLYTPFVTASQVQLWKTRMAVPIQNVIRNSWHNWRTYAMKGEWYRAKRGYVNKDTAIKWLETSWATTQRWRFTRNIWDFYHDEDSDPLPWAYKAVSRSNLGAMIADGYTGASRKEILDILKRGGKCSLLMQDPSGQCISGGRSADHTWNDILVGNGFEIMAELAYKEGDLRSAGQYRHAAEHAFLSTERWRRPDGTYSVTKNHFDPALRVGYADYSFFTNYNGNMMYHMAENYLRHQTAITEQPAPNDIGGYTIVSDTALATAVANAGGMFMQVSLRGSTTVSHSRYWNALGVVRFARPAWDSRLGPSVGVRETSSKLGVSFAPTFLENGSWVRLASVPDRYQAYFSTQFIHPLLVRCQIIYKPRTGYTGPSFTNSFVITPDGILSTLTSTASNFGITWPLLIFDGTTSLTTSVTTHTASTSFPGSSDQQNFIALHSSPVITATDAVRRSSYGDLRPVRMASGTSSNQTFVYPRSAGDPSADSVRKSFVQSGNDFSTILGKVKGNSYIGRTSAGGVGTSIDLNNDNVPEATFSSSTGFLMQLKAGAITKIETDRGVTATIYGKEYNLGAYTPVDVFDPAKMIIAKVVASSSQSGNPPVNTIDRNFNTRWSALGNNQWIRYQLDSASMVKNVKIAWYKGNERKEKFDIQTSLDTINWRTVFSGYSSGTTTAFETYTIAPTYSAYVRVLGHGNTLSLWNSITETELVNDTTRVSTVVELLHLISVQLDSAQAFSNKASYPRSTNPDGSIERVNASDWTSGFFPGSLWYMYESTKDTAWKSRAEAWTAGLESQKYNRYAHDVGFMLFSSFGQGYRLTCNLKYKEILLQGAKSLATRFNATVGCIRSWNTYHFPVIIDNMMNLELLFWATKISGDSSYYKIAVKHALTTIANQFGPDNSSYHIVDYDPDTGNVLAKFTAQGLNNSSDWARGQAWGLYGFTMCYRETKDVRFLAMAKKIADFYISHPNMPADLVPNWDFDASDYRDASAACIAAAALIELSQYVPEKADVYYHFGTSTLKTLSSARYLAAKGTNNYFVLNHSIGNRPANVEVDKPLNFADYYFIQALLRQKKPAPIVAVRAANNKICLAWNASTGALFYSVKRSDVKGGVYKTLASNLITTTYVDVDVTAGKNYYYKVTPADVMGEGETSTEQVGVVDVVPTSSFTNKAAVKSSPRSDKAERNRSIGFAISPNPSNAFVNIQLSGVPLDKPILLLIISEAGTPVRAIQSNSQNQNFRFDISSLAKGAYTIALVVGRQVLYKPFVKM